MVYIVFICCTLPVYECDFMRCMKMAVYNIDYCMWFVCIIVYLIVFDWLCNNVFADLVIVFDVYPCLLWICYMSVNIQFMETGNLLTPDKGDMSGFLLATLYLSGAWASDANGLAAAWPYAHPWSAGRRCSWPNFERQYSSAGSGELRAGSVVCGRTLFRAVALVRLPVPVVCRDGHAWYWPQGWTSP